MSSSYSSGLAFEGWGDPSPGLETDRQALARQFRLCRHAHGPHHWLSGMAEQMQAFAVPRVVSLLLAALWLLSCVWLLT